MSTLRTSSESHNQGKKHFQKKPLYFRIYAHFEADKENDISGIRNKTTITFKQKPVLNGYPIESELIDFLKSASYKYSLGYNNVHWFVNEVIYLENKMAFYSKNNKKDIIMSEKDEEDFKNDNICRFCEKNIESDKLRDQCHLTVKYRGPAHNTCNISITQQQSNIIQFLFHIFSNFDCRIFFKKLVDKKRIK